MILQVLEYRGLLVILIICFDMTILVLNRFCIIIDIKENFHKYEIKNNISQIKFSIMLFYL